MMPIRLSPTVKMILIACLVAFVVQQSVDLFFGGHLREFFGLVPAGFVFEFRFWQLLTFPFLHADVFHLFLNLLMIAFIGTDLELIWGRRKFLVFYFLCSIFAGVVYLLLQTKLWGGIGLQTPMVGASASIFGLLMAYGIYFGERQMLFMMIFPMKARHFIWVLAAIELMTTVFSGRAGLSSAAHIAGMFAGLSLIWLERRFKLQGKWREWTQFSGSREGRKSRKRASHLKLIKDGDDDDRDRGPKTWH